MVLRTRPDFATAGGALSASDSNWTTCGGEVTLILTNTGSTAINQSVVDTLPGGYVFDSSGACTVTAANTPSGVVHDTDPGNAGNQPLNCNGVSGATPTWGPSNLDAVFPGETITIRYYVKTDGSTYCDTTKANDAVDPADVPIPNLTNRVTFNHQDSCAATYNPTNTDSINPRQPDIDIVKSPEKQIVAEGGTATWTITLTNKGDAPAGNITLTDELGNGFTSPADNRERVVERKYLHLDHPGTDQFGSDLSGDHHGHGRRGISARPRHCGRRLQGPGGNSHLHLYS